jgi:hypothetical protein
MGDMPTNWRDALAVLREILGISTARQKALAATAGVVLPKRMPRIVAAARLQSALQTDLGLRPSYPCAAGTLEYMSKLDTGALKVKPKPLDQREAQAWITFFYMKRREAALEALRLEAGDLVQTRDSAPDIEEISSIGGDGRLYFKGGAGAGAWPDQVTVRCRHDENSDNARALRATASAQASRRSRIRSWTEQKDRELAPFRVLEPLAELDIEQLREVIESAGDEKPIQVFLQTRPQIIAALLGGRERFVLPKPELGNKYVPDFLIADADSLGIHWFLIELETPHSQVTLRKSNELDAKARKGVSQVKEWREWLLNNLPSARQSRRKDGLGLVDIRSSEDGFVLVGRRELLRDNADAVRSQLREREGIHVHTYDWLLERLRGVLAFDGPPGANPNLLRSRQPYEGDDLFGNSI